MILQLKKQLASSQEQEGDRFILWCPVFIGIGILVYFSLNFEPPVTTAYVFPVVAVLLIWLARQIRQIFYQYIFYLLLLAILGFSVAQIKSHLVTKPRIESPDYITINKARVFWIEMRQGRRQLWLDQIELANRKMQENPHKLRISVPRHPPLKPGDYITLKANLRPPSAPAFPGAVDFQRQYWFQKLGGTGYATRPVQRLFNERPTDSLTPDIWIKISHFRHDLAIRISNSLSGEQAALAKALILGERGGISRKLYQDIRDSGLAHLLAISGLHLGLIASVVFFFARAILAAIPHFALYYPIKKWAAVPTIMVTFAYLILAGFPIPTQRAFLMTTVFLLAMMIDRKALSIRLVAFAATIILLIFPESLPNPGFQMSFSAVLALVAVFDSNRVRNYFRRFRVGFFARLYGYFLALILSSFIAGLATMPFAVFHFGRIADYALIANMLAIPVMAFWILPSALVALLAMLADFEYLPLRLMGEGIDILLFLARMIASWPGSHLLIPPMPPVSFLLLVYALLNLFLWRGRIRYFSVILIAVALLLNYHRPIPHILVTGAEGAVFIYPEENQFLVSDRRRDQYQLRLWKNSLGGGVSRSWPASGDAPRDNLACDLIGCLYQYRHLKIAFPDSSQALQEDCLRADILIARFFPVSRTRCRKPKIIIDRRKLTKQGAFLIYFDKNPEDGLEVKTLSVGQWRGKRIWSLP